MNLCEKIYVLQKTRPCNFFFTIFIIVSIIGSYFMAVGLTTGFIVASYPGYDFNTGCSTENPGCRDISKMLCYRNKMKVCYVLAIVVDLTLIAFAVTIWLLVLCIKNYCPNKSNSEHTTLV